ncbi:hypothetical protein I4U23_016892 [Adineta vaga]|nr:hypothetical protein I4U23_016892 [Adineta vaga]
MALTNINRQIQDPFNRYKMPKLVVQVIKERNSFKTILVNLSDIAKALHRSPLYIVKYLTLELNSSMKINKKSNQYIISGNYNPEILQNLLDGFINLFVLCKICENPETDLDYNEENSKGISQRCFACGNTSEIRIECHDLVKFICQNWSEDDRNKNQYNWNKMINLKEENSIFFSDISIDDDWNDDDLFFNDEQFLSLFQESNRTIQKTIETDTHEYANKFIQWLRTAEETDDDDNQC